MLCSLSHFETDLPEQDHALSFDDAQGSLVAVVHNLLQRGIPTRASVFLEEYLLKTWGGIELHQSETGTLNYRSIQPTKELVKDLFDALCIVDPRIAMEPLAIWERTKVLESSLEKRFLMELVGHLGSPCWLQVLELQRSLTNILTYAYESGEYVSELQAQQPFDRYDRQRVDISIELPRDREGQKKGLVIEVDGSQHLNLGQRHLDEQRDFILRLVQTVRWSVLRVATTEFGSMPTKLKEHEHFFSGRYLKQVQANYEKPIHERPEGLRALSLALTPLASARIQRVLIELLLDGTLSLSAEVWRIGVIERDVDCGRIACLDLGHLLAQLSSLVEEPLKLPRIEVTVFDTPEFRCPHTADHQKQPIEKAVEFAGDVLLDVSVLQRWGLSQSVRSKAGRTVTIRSAHSKKTTRRFISAKPIKYASMAAQFDERTDVDLERISMLREVIRSVFRKQNFREGQLPVMSRALQLNSVVGLLPTGGGKSLTYQLCTLLQPGHTMVVDPIKALMEDQDEGLKKNWIDATVFVNSNQDQFQRGWAQQQIVRGGVLMAFVSPERFLIDRFRNDLKQMSRERHCFSYCVIDEAHCVSEWGHDFRTAYLRLGDNARRYCSTWSEDPVRLFGLTATASFDVRTDVRRELEIPEEDIVESLSIERKELNYRVHQVEVVASNRETIAREKLQVLNTVLDELPINLAKVFDALGKPFDPLSFYQPDEKGKYRNGILIFCPHAKKQFGVDAVANGIEARFGKIGTFRGGDGDEHGGNQSAENQRRFLNDEINILVATKGFGMGIDKANVRATIHFNFPSSIESFVQEAGRAGRDREPAYCDIIYNTATDSDEEVLSYFHKQNFPSVEHDLAMLKEVLVPIKEGWHSSSEAKVSTEAIVPFFGDNGLRREKDTFKAIYRLALLGVIDDYEVNYNEKTVHVFSSKHDRDYYRQRFENYLSLYLSPRRVQEVLNGTTTGSMDLAAVLIAYVYENVGQKRGRAIKEMRSICEGGVTDPEHLGRELQLHFTSKYYRPMLEDTGDGQEFDLKVLSKYMTETQGNTDLLEHLRGSCSRILVDNPRNGGVLLLRAYSVLLLETQNDRGKLKVRNEKLFNGALEDLETGLDEYQGNQIDPMHALECFSTDLLSHAEHLRPVLDDLALNQTLRKHTRWVREFNHRYDPSHVNN